jgi:hypothetical protein
MLPPQGWQQPRCQRAGVGRDAGSCGQLPREAAAHLPSPCWLASGRAWEGRQLPTPSSSAWMRRERLHARESRRWAGGSSPPDRTPAGRALPLLHQHSSSMPALARGVAERPALPPVERTHRPRLLAAGEQHDTKPGLRLPRPRACLRSAACSACWESVAATTLGTPRTASRYATAIGKRRRCWHALEEQFAAAADQITLEPPRRAQLPQRRRRPARQHPGVVLHRSAGPLPPSM